MLPALGCRIQMASTSCAGADAAWRAWAAHEWTDLDGGGGYGDNPRSGTRQECP